MRRTAPTATSAGIHGVCQREGVLPARARGRSSKANPAARRSMPPRSTCEAKLKRFVLSVSLWPIRAILRWIMRSGPTRAMEHAGIMKPNMPMPHRQPIVAIAESAMNAAIQGRIMNGMLTSPLASPLQRELVLSATISWFKICVLVCPTQ